MLHHPLSVMRMSLWRQGSAKDSSIKEKRTLTLQKKGVSGLITVHSVLVICFLLYILSMKSTVQPWTKLGLCSLYKMSLEMNEWIIDAKQCREF